MPKQKYDWNKIKMEFMLSDEDEVKVFIEDKLRKSINWNIRKLTAWRWKEKQLYKQKIYEEALKKKWKETAKEVADKMERYEMLWDEILNRMEEQFQWAVGEDWKPKKINSNDIMNIWKIKRTEMWLPTNISKTENTNREERVELSEEETEALEKLMWSKKAKK